MADSNVKLEFYGDWDATSQGNFLQHPAHQAVIQHAHSRQFSFCAVLGTGIAGRWDKIAGKPEFSKETDGSKIIILLYKDSENSDFYCTCLLKLNYRGEFVSITGGNKGKIVLGGVDVTRNAYENHWAFQASIIALAQLLELPVVQVLPGPLDRIHVSQGGQVMDEKEGRQHTEVWFKANRGSTTCFPARFYFNADDSLDLSSVVFGPEQYSINTTYNCTLFDMNVKPALLHHIVRACATGGMLKTKEPFVNADFWFEYLEGEHLQPLLAKPMNDRKYSKHTVNYNGYPLREYYQNHNYKLRVDYTTVSGKVEQRLIELRRGGNAFFKRCDAMIEKEIVAKSRVTAMDIPVRPLTVVNSWRPNDDPSWPHFEVVRMCEQIGFFVARDCKKSFQWAYIRSKPHCTTNSYGTPNEVCDAHVTVVFKEEDNLAAIGYNAHLYVRAWDPANLERNIQYPLELVAVEWFPPNNLNNNNINRTPINLWRGGNWIGH